MQSQRERYEVPVTLVDGRTVGSWSEDWREECEARAVCKLPRKHDRRMYLLAVEKKRGREAMKRLELLVFAVWRAEFATGA